MDAMEAIRVLVVEDEARQQQRLVRMVEALSGFAVAGACATGGDAVEAIRALAPDLVLLDVQLPGLSGVEVLDALAPEPLPAVVFVTAYDQYAVRAFEHHAVDYLLKPFDDERFERTMERARARVRQGRLHAAGTELHALLRAFGQPPPSPPAEPPTAYLQRIALKTGGRILLLRTDEIDWIEGAGVYARLHAGARHYALRETLGALEARLDPTRFARIHRSAIVQIDRIRELVAQPHGEYVVVLTTGTRLKLTRSYRDRLDAIAGRLG